MRLDSITRIERYMVDALVTSPLVPLGVNVIRLADENDAEGIVNMVQSIAVRYVSSHDRVCVCIRVLLASVTLSLSVK